MVKNSFQFLIFYLLLNLTFGDLFSQSYPDFYKEDVIFEMKGDTFYVQGIYFIRSSQPNTSLNLLYPFQVDSLMNEPVIEKAFDITHNCDLVIQNKSKDFIAFKVNFDSISETLFLIRYYQILKSNQARYILLSTQSWDKPLSQANYKLIIPQKVKIATFSYSPDKEFIKDDEKIYIWQKENFMPDRDFIIQFKK